jgi:intracellular septation protein
MKALLHSARLVAYDMASSLLFFALFAVTGNVILAAVAGMTFALAQIGWQVASREPITALQWVSLVSVLASGTTTLVTKNPTFMMLQVSLVYLLLGAAMLKRGWQLRYLPPIAVEAVPDLAIGFGYAWAGLMFLSAAVNLGLALTLSATSWGAAMAVWAPGSKIALFLIQYAAMKTIGRRRYRARQTSGQDQFAFLHAA